MFIASFRPGGPSLNGARCKVRPIHRPVHCAPPELQIVGGRLYKHLAPLAPEHYWCGLAAPCRCGYLSRNVCADTPACDILSAPSPVVQISPFVVLCS